MTDTTRRCPACDEDKADDASLWVLGQGPVKASLFANGLHVRVRAMIAAYFSDVHPDGRVVVEHIHEPICRECQAKAIKALADSLRETA